MVMRRTWRISVRGISGGSISSIILASNDLSGARSASALDVGRAAPLPWT